MDIIAVFCLILLRLRIMCLDNNWIAFQSKARFIIKLAFLSQSCLWKKTYINNEPWESVIYYWYIYIYIISCILYLLKIWKYYYLLIFIIIHKYLKILFTFRLLIDYPIFDLIKIIQKVGGTNDTLSPTLQKVGGTYAPLATPMGLTLRLRQFVPKLTFVRKEERQFGKSWHTI